MKVHYLLACALALATANTPVRAQTYVGAVGVICSAKGETVRVFDDVASNRSRAVAASTYVLPAPIYETRRMRLRVTAAAPHVWVHYRDVRWQRFSRGTVGDASPEGMATRGFDQFDADDATALCEGAN